MTSGGDIISIDIFGYLDYRKYLSDLTRKLKERGDFNLRQFAARAGIRAPGYLKMVIDGGRRLTPETVQKFCRALDISGRQKFYFEKLVLYNQSKDPDLKKEYLDDLMSLKPRSADYILEKRQNRYFSRPYFVTIREMVALADFKEEPKWIAHRCFPPIRPSEAREAIDTLLELGLLKRNEEGRLVQTEKFIQTQDKNTQALEAYHFHEAVLNKARHALGMLKQSERNYYALTLPLPREMFSEIVDEFYAFRDQIINRVHQKAKNFDEVYQFNFQLFPVTKKEGSS